MPRGISDERSLVNLLSSMGFAVIRSPASGASTKMPRPDIIAGKKAKGLQYAIEAKTTREKVLYADKESIHQLLVFSETFGCKPLLAVKFKGRRRTWLFLRPSDLTQTRRDNYRISYEEASALGMDLRTISGEGRQLRLNL